MSKMAKIEPKIFDELKTALVSFGDKYFVAEELNRSKLTDDLRNYDEALLSKLFEVDFIKQHFIKEVAGQKLFQIEQLEEAVLYNDYWDTSYTKYENRVGLASKGKFLQDSQDVVLDFPFKDGVLTASMTKEDSEDGYDDAFLNEVIEKDEIDRLFDKKVFVNVKRFGDNLIAQVDNGIVSFDKEKDNLIIKGNNLLALHTLKEKFSGQVKLIYIDPPYNTGKDSFKYNDKFNKSTWLTFMKNRLEIAREFLTEDGVLVVQVDDKMQAELKLLLNDVMGEEQFETTFHVQVRYANKTLSEDNDFQKVMEVAHVYSKDTNVFKPSKIKEEYSLDKFSFEVIEKSKPIETIMENGKKVDVFGPDDFEIVAVEGAGRRTAETDRSGCSKSLESALLGGNTMKANLRKKKPLQVLWHIVKVTHFSNFILSFVCYLFLAALILLFTEPAIETFGDSIWYSFVTSTTTGYGDIVVTTAIGRIVSVILSLYGLLFFGCLSGIVVTYYMEMNKLLPKEEDQK